MVEKQTFDYCKLLTKVIRVYEINLAIALNCVLILKEKCISKLMKATIELASKFEITRST